VLYDACVLYPAPMRDLLMHLALTGFYTAKWSNDIHEEWINNLLKKRPDLKRRQLNRTRQRMDRHAEDALVTEYEPLIDVLTLPDPNDRHVLAAAIQGKVDRIITLNLKDFPDKYLAQFDIEAQHPDQFIAYLIDLAPDIVCRSIKRLRESLKSPPKTVLEYLNILNKQSLPKTVAWLKKHKTLIQAEINSNNDSSLEKQGAPFHVSIFIIRLARIVNWQVL